MTQRLTIEVFRDTVTPDVDIACVEGALELLHSHDREFLDIMRTTRTIRLGEGAMAARNVLVPAWQSVADLNVIVTDRQIEFDTKSMPTNGVAVRRLDGNHVMSRTALVSVHENANPDITAGHELGHLLGLKNSGHMHDGHGHCLDYECMMLAGNKRVEYEDTTWPSFTNRDEAYNGLGLEHRQGNALCMECEQYMDEQVFWLRQKKQGEPTPPGMIV